MTTRADFIEKLRERFGKDVEEPLLEEFFLQAKDRYDQDRPRHKILTVTGDGSTYEWTLTDWDDTISYILSVEYPAGKKVPVFLKPARYAVIETDGTFKLRLLYDVPSATEKVEIVYTTPHIVSDTQSTIPERDFWAVVDLAASMIARFLASQYFRMAETYEVYEQTIDFGRKGENYISLARVWETNYTIHIQRTVALMDRIEPIKDFLGLVRA